MQNKIHIGSRQVILNYSRAYPKNRESLLGSDSFKRFISYFIHSMKEDSPKLYDYVLRHGKFTEDEATENFVTFLRILAIFKIEEIDSEYLDERDTLL